MLLQSGPEPFTWINRIYRMTKHPASGNSSLVFLANGKYAEIKLLMLRRIQAVDIQLLDIAFVILDRRREFGHE